MNRSGPGQGSAQIHEGAILGGRYRVEAAIDLAAEGAAEASTASGVDLTTGLVAIRVFRLGPGQVARGALAVARAAMELRSEHAERVIDAGEIDARTIYLVTEARAGVDLAALVARAGPLPSSLATALVAQACEAIADAHAQGVCHGDLSPARLFAARLGDALSIKVTGFGEPRLHSPGDTRGDLWALGALLFFLLAGSPPHRSLDLRAIRPSVPVALEHVVMRCLDPDPRARYASAAELGRALAFFLPPSDELAPSPPPSRPVGIRAVAVLAILGFAAFTGLAFSTARPADIATALLPFRALLGPSP